ncbi:MAG: hypothetical protein FJ086_18650 [Deltaproteobacteria bacterium]|nr:hypothetical protein [Deltaproteobacteria bacterium]
MRPLLLPALLLATSCFESLTAFPKQPAPDAGQPPTVDAGSACDLCPAPVHAALVCRDGRCGRGPCEAGFYDVDGPVTPGCESTCVGTTCALPDGRTVTLTVPAVHDLGPAGATSSTGLQSPTGDGRRHPAALGEPTGSVPSSNTTYRHTGGFHGATP